MRAPWSVCLLLAVLSAGAPALAAEPTEARWTTIVDLRVRQEILDEVYHFVPEADRNWIRVRSRFGGTWERGAHGLELRLTNEHRHMLTPDEDFDWDELILDHAFWGWNIDPQNRLTLGRQDIIWPGGFLMLEGHPLDGSRSIYQNALRWRGSPSWGTLDAALIHNPKYDEIVLIDDEGIPLSDADEIGAVLRLTRGGWAGALLYKFEHDPDGKLDDLGTLTMSARREGSFREHGKWHAELANQFQDGELRVAADGKSAAGTGWAFAAEAQLSHPIAEGWVVELGAFWYSGLDGDIRPFRAPWARWPKWSEMYLYSLIGESTPGRVHVAAWEDIAAPWVRLKHALRDGLNARVTARYLLAPAAGDARGWLTEAKLEADLGSGLKAHLLWEMLDPGSYHDGRYGLPPLDSTVQFLRWEISWAL